MKEEEESPTGSVNKVSDTTYELGIQRKKRNN